MWGYVAAFVLIFLLWGVPLLLIDNLLVDKKRTVCQEITTLITLCSDRYGPRQTFRAGLWFRKTCILHEFEGETHVVYLKHREDVTL